MKGAGAKKTDARERTAAKTEMTGETMENSGAWMNDPSYSENAGDANLSAMKLFMRDVSHYPLLTPGEELDLAVRAREGDREARNRLVSCNLRLVIGYARNFIGCGLPFEDIVQEGAIGLMKAAERFDPGKGYRFSTYATWWLRQTISRALANSSRIIRLPVHLEELLGKIRRITREYEAANGLMPTIGELAEKCGETPERVQEALDFQQELISLDAPVGDDDATVGQFIVDGRGVNPEGQLVRRSELKAVTESMDVLDDREKLVIRLRYGFADDRVHTLDDIGEQIGVTRERVRQIEARALRKMLAWHKEKDLLS